MAAKGSGDGDRIDLHVIHGLQDVAHEADAGAAEVVQDMGYGAPLADLPAGCVVAMETAYDGVGDGAAQAYRHAGELRDGAEVIVEKLAVYRGVFTVEALVALEGDEDYRALEFAHERRARG